MSDAEARAWFGLLALVALGLPQVERTTREHGLVYIEFLLLAELASTPGGRRMNELASCVQASPSRLSHRMRKLIDLGYAERHPSPGDGRGSIACITERGRAVVEHTSPAVLRDLRRLVFDPLSPNQVKALADAMTTVTQHLEASTADP